MISLACLRQEIEKFLNLDRLGLKVVEEQNKLIIVQKNKDWKTSKHLALWYKEGKLYLTLDICFCPEEDKEKVEEELNKIRQYLEEKLKPLKEKYPCLFDDYLGKKIGSYGILIKVFNTELCEILMHILQILCIMYNN